MTFPLPAVTSCLTFSRITALGFFASMNLRSSKKREPRGSWNPFRWPIMENGWHGNPASSRSWSGTSSGCRSEMSPAGVMSKLCEYAVRAFLSMSHAKTTSCPMLRAAMWNPPIPLKKSAHRHFVGGIDSAEMLLNRVQRWGGSYWCDHLFGEFVEHLSVNLNSVASEVCYVHELAAFGVAVHSDGCRTSESTCLLEA